MKKVFKKALQKKQEQRARNAARPVVEKFRTLDRLREAGKLLKRAKPVGAGRASD